jgi:hypothetical protein
VQVVVVAVEDLDDRRRSAKARVRPHEDSLRSGSSEEVDQGLRQPKINLAHAQRRALSPVEPRVVHVDIEAVLRRGAGRTSRRAAC